MSRTSVEPGRLLAGRYRLEHLLGEGGMGQVWVARHTALSRMVAVKLMTPEAHESMLMRARFEREARACGQLRSPHVVQVFDYGVEDDVPYLVMELLEGEDLSTLRETRPIWPVAEVASLLAQAAEGLAEAHELGIVHRDIKPSNLFVARVGGQRVLKILDFGIAKTFEHQGPQMTGTNVQLGSPNYMSPEQVMSGDVDGRSDLWALGVVAFRLLTGEPPFRGEASILVAQKILRGQRLAASEVVDGLPPAIDAFLDRALAIAPAERFQTASELASALRALATAHAGVVARPRAPGSPIASQREAATAADEPLSDDDRDPAFADTATPESLAEKPRPAPTDFNATMPMPARSPLLTTRLSAGTDPLPMTQRSAPEKPAPARGQDPPSPPPEPSFAATLAMEARSPFVTTAPTAPLEPVPAPRAAPAAPATGLFDDATTRVQPRIEEAATRVRPRVVRSRPIDPSTTVATTVGVAAARSQRRQGVLLGASMVAIVLSVATVWWALGSEDLRGRGSDEGRPSGEATATPAPQEAAPEPAHPKASLDEVPSASAPTAPDEAVPSTSADPSLPASTSSASPGPTASGRRAGPGTRRPTVPTSSPRSPDDILDTAR